jgi:hypothetical protein
MASSAAMAAVEHVGREEISLLIDTMHVARSGAGPDDLRSLPAELDRSRPAL